jgi:Cytochrome c7 and related cytochrome c
MPQIFRPSANSLAQVAIVTLVLLAIGIPTTIAIVQRSSLVTGVGVVQAQPVFFSHKHHVSDDGIDCRYCHTSVEESPFAGMPSIEICMNCHRQIWNESPMLEPIRTSYRTNTPIEWKRVHDLPDFVYFDHSIHVAKGVGCETCHGRVDQMPLLWRVNTLQMDWCLECHRHPERHVRPRDQVFTMGWRPPDDDQIALGSRLVQAYRIQRKTDCSTCHR